MILQQMLELKEDIVAVKVLVIKSFFYETEYEVLEYITPIPCVTRIVVPGKTCIMRNAL